MKPIYMEVRIQFCAACSAVLRPPDQQAASICFGTGDAHLRLHYRTGAHAAATHLHAEEVVQKCCTGAAANASK